MRYRILLALPLLAGCMVGPDYQKPAAPVSADFKELAGWKPATPMDAIDRGAWWRIYNDPLLDSLERQVVVNNQTVAGMAAAYQQSRAVVDEARANLFPVLAANAGATRGSSSFGGASSRTTYTLEATPTWDLDVWGKIRRQVESDVAAAQYSAASLANALLSAQASLATDYFELRVSDALQRVLDRTVADDQRALTITQNQYAVGVAARSDVITAQTQLQTTQALAINVGVARHQYEHAIAVLTGKAPSELSIPPGEPPQDVPVPPVSLPSALLERRPDIAGAERTMAEQNALIGAAIAGYYPDISLSAVFGYAGSPLSSLISVSNRVWSVGASAAQTIFNGGLTGAQVSAARAAYDQSVASYRQTVLTAFQQVEDNLSNLRILQQQETVQRSATDLARKAVAITLNEYRAGTVAYTAVVTAQNTALSDEQTLLSVHLQRLTASVALIEALGGGWSTADLPPRADLTRHNPLAPGFPGKDAK
jgi:NodT family efflux transporter outer membrane factor (OMF) lipoprotein